MWNRWYLFSQCREQTHKSLKLMGQSAAGIYICLLDHVGKYDTFSDWRCAATCLPSHWLTLMMSWFSSLSLPVTFRWKFFFYSLANMNPNTWWKPVLQKYVSSLNTILPTYWMVKYKHECAFYLIRRTGVKCLYTCLLLQYCGQPGVLLHHSHRGAVQQSKWKHQAGHQGQGGCMTETLDFIIFILMNKRLLFMEYYSRKVWNDGNGGVEMEQSPLLSLPLPWFQTARGIVG